MPNRLSLDDSSYAVIYEKAMERLREQAPWWTNTEISDPGITLLEMWAILSDMQSFYLDQIQESHYRKYLKLLGCAPDEGESAFAWVFFDNVSADCTVPEGTRLLADRMVFETEEETRLTGNRVVGFYQESGRNRANTMFMFRKNRFSLQGAVSDEKELFSFALREPAEKEFCFFVLLDERGRRNPAEPDFYMARLAWEYLTGEGWREARVLRDETAGLLYSGRVCLHMEQPMISQAGTGYVIRCRIKEGSFDAMPVLYRICLNACRVSQKNTLCREERVLLAKEKNTIALKSYAAKTGELRLFRKRGKNMWQEITEECVLEPPITPERQERSVHLIPNKPGQGDTVIKIVCSIRGTEEEYGPCHITGVTSQQLALPWESVMRSSVKLMLRSHTGSCLYRECAGVEPEEDRYEYAWHWQENEAVIVLGDGRHGDIPKEAEDGLLLTSLALWEGEKGNVSIGRIAQWERPELFPDITCANLMPGKGGRNRRKPSEQFAAIKDMFQRQNRMVTEEDISRLAMETPGLMLREARAEWKDGMTVVTIFPAKPLNDRYCQEKYINSTLRYLEQYRMAASRIRVVIGEGANP